MRIIQVQGYAIPWNKPGFAELGEESAAPGSISAPSASGANVTLLFGGHETEGRPTYASTAKRTLSFFADDYGLGFSAWLDDEDPRHVSIANAIADGGVSQCSVLLLAPRFITDEATGNARLIHARIGHVALVAQGAYSDTGCWLASQSWRDSAPQLLSMRESYGETMIKRGREGKGWSPSSSSRSAAASCRVHVPQSLLGLMDRPDWGTIRNRHTEAMLAATASRRPTNMGARL